MKNTAPALIKEEEPKDEVSFNLVDPNDIYEFLGSDFELGDEVELTIKGKVTRFDANKSKDYEHGCFTLELISANGKTGKQIESDNEREDVEKEYLPKNKKGKKQNEDDSKD